MIIDFHSHIAFHKIYPENFLKGLFEDSNNPINKEKLLKILKSFLKDLNGVKFIKQMDKANVKKSVLLIIDHCDYIGQSELSIEANYLLHKMILETYPDRLVVFAGVHPNTKGSFELLKKGIENYGFSGIKLYPPFGYKLTDHRLIECYEYANQNKLPILSHTGYSTKGLCNDFADPKYFDELSLKYPHAKFIMAHAGIKLSDPTIRRLLKRDNVFADISGFLTANEEDKLLIFSEEFSDKLLFGSDFPIVGLMNSLKNIVDELNKIFENYGNNNTEVWEKIMFKNAEKILSK